MNAMTCPYCGKRQMVLETVPNHLARLGGIDVHVKQARISKCRNCSRIMVAAEEIKRWRELQRQQLQERGHIPASGELTRIRESLKLSVADLAALLGVTRQAVHAWEHAGPMPLGPASLILRLLRAELEGRCQGILAELVASARARGQEVGVPDVAVANA